MRGKRKSDISRLDPFITQIMRTFVKLREMIIANKELAGKLEVLEKKYDEQFKVVFDILRKLMKLPEKPRRQIGFNREEENDNV